jgi:hypothetical protein
MKPNDNENKNANGSVKRLIRNRELSVEKHALPPKPMSHQHGNPKAPQQKHPAYLDKYSPYVRITQTQGEMGD